MAEHPRVAIVTGGGSGIGRAVALTLASGGFQVVVAGRRREALEETVLSGTAEGGQVTAVPTDVSDPAAVESLFDAAVQAYGRVDLLFNNAGLTAPAVPLEELSIEQWTSVVEVNLTGAFLCIREAFRVMKEQDPMGGRIINNGSVSAHAPRPHSAPYTATKHAITGLTRSAALDGRVYNIACGQIDIGNTMTEMTEEMAAGILQANGTTAPEPRLALTHVAKAVLYMADLPLDANVLFMTVMATKMPLVGRG